MRHLRVLLLDPDIAAAYCGRLFACVGANVVVLEDADGNSLRRAEPLVVDASGETVSALWEYLGSGLRSMHGGDAERDALIAWADLVVSTCDGDADGALALRAHIRSVNPRAVHVVTSGYGLTGPYRNWRRSELTDWAGGGHMFLTGEPDREPLQGGGPWVSYLTGATAAVGAQAALLEAVRSGEGQLVDVSALEAVASLHQWTITMYTHTGCVKQRWGNRFGESVHPIALYPCSDGWISIVAPAYQSFEALCLLVDRAELLLDDDFKANAVRFDRADEIDPYIIAWTSVRSAAQAVGELQAAGVPASVLNTFTRVLEEPQLEERGYWKAAPHLGPRAKHPLVPFRTDAYEPSIERAPSVGADTDPVLAMVRSGATRPPLPHIDLSTIRMSEFSIAWAGPLAGRWLADLGVDVVMVEHPATRGVAQRTDLDPDWEWGRLPAAHLRFPVFPNAVPGERWWNRMGIFNKMNRSKRSLCLDAKTGRGGEILAGVLAASDVVLNNYSPRGARSLGVDETGVRRHNPMAVTVSMSGYGATGPLAGFLSYGPVLQAHAGFDEATGYEDTGPVRLGLAFPDCVGGLHGAFAAINALWERDLTGKAVHADISQFEALLSIAGETVLATSVTGNDPARRGNRSATCSPQGAYRCPGDDEWVAISVVDDGQWVALLAVLRADGVEIDPRDGIDLHDDTDPGDGIGPERWDKTQRRARQDVIDTAITSWTIGRSPIDAATRLQAAGVPALPVMTNQAIVEDPHVISRGFVATWDQTDVGPMRFPGFPVHFERLVPRLATCPGLGADNADVLRDRMGLDAAEVASLYAEGVIGDRPPDPESGP